MLLLAFSQLGHSYVHGPRVVPRCAIGSRAERRAHFSMCSWVENGAGFADKRPARVSIASQTYSAIIAFIRMNDPIIVGTLVVLRASYSEVP